MDLHNLTSCFALVSEYLNVEDIVRMSSLNRIWRKVANNSVIWENKFKSIRWLSGVRFPLLTNSNYKQDIINRYNFLKDQAISLYFKPNVQRMVSLSTNYVDFLRDFAKGSDFNGPFVLSIHCHVVGALPEIRSICSTIPRRKGTSLMKVIGFENVAQQPIEYSTNFWLPLNKKSETVLSDEPHRVFYCKLYLNKRLTALSLHDENNEEEDRLESIERRIIEDRKKRSYKSLDSDRKRVKCPLEERRD
jgi:hypothetical protein